MARSKTIFDWRILLLLPVPLLWALAGHYNRLQKVENWLLDLRFWYRGKLEAPVNVVYVDLDTKAFQKIGERPWNRGDFAEVGRLLMEAGAKLSDAIRAALGSTHD